MNSFLKWAGRRGTVLLAALLSLQGCATKGDLRDVQTELRSIAAGQAAVLEALQIQSRMTQDSLRGTTDQLFEIRGTVNQQLARILDQMGILRQENAENQRVMASIRDQLEALRRQAQAPQGNPPGVSGTGPLLSGSSTVVELYNAAIRQFNNGNLQAARTGFAELVQQYPGDELAPEAQFKLGEILAEEGRPQDAIAAFERLPQLYPTAARVPEALYRMGLLHLEGGRRDEARRYLNLVVNTYPDHAMAGQASSKLREIGPG
jgi:tol-pal system protein YbgF